MSLVHEALQKAEREKQRKTGVWQAPEPKPASKPVQQLGSTEPLPATGVKRATDGSPVGSVATATAVTTFAVSRPASQAAAADPQKKPSGLLPVLIACVSLVAIVAIVFLVSLAASTIRESHQTVRAAGPAPIGAGDVQPARTATITDPKADGSALLPVVASDPVAASGPPPSPASIAPGFRLTGIMILPDGKYAAVLNGRVAYEADDVGGATVKTIQRDHLTLVDVQGKEIVLRLN